MSQCFVRRWNSTTLLKFLLEPDSLANLVTNMAVSKCANAHDAYLECTNYAVTQLNLPNVAMYLDAGKQSPMILGGGYFDLLRVRTEAMSKYSFTN